MLLEERVNVAFRAVEREQWDAAWEILRDILNEEPEHPGALFLVGLVLRAQGHMGAALQMFRRVLALVPNKVNVWLHYGATLHDLNKYDDAREAFLVAHKELPDDGMPVANIASGFTQLGRNRDAIEWANKALALDPNSRIAKIAKGFSSLSLGRWPDGWQYLAELYGDTLQVRIYNPDPEPEWDGTPGLCVCVQCDQGVGDQVMFSQCIPDLQAVASKVIVECAGRMVRYFERNFPGIEVHGTLKQKRVDWTHGAGIQAHTHISYLGKWFRVKDGDFPRRAYIKPDPVLVDKWREWLMQFPRPWVGLSWKGGIPQTNKASRSVDLEQYASIMEMPGTYIDMSYEASGLQVARWNLNHEQQVVSPPIDVNNYDDTIALTAVLDDVVTVTTTLAHVCGALGRHAYVLVPQAPAWRYAYRVDDGRGMIWYHKSSVALYRQKPGEEGFGMAIGRVVKDMAAIRSLRAA